MNEVSIFISDYKIICLLKYRGQGQGRLEDTFTKSQRSRVRTDASVRNVHIIPETSS